MDELSLRWKMEHAGSAIVELSFQQQSVEMHTTYVGDGLRSIVQAATDLCLGSSAAMAFLPNEPWGTCLFFGNADEEVYLQIVEFADMESVSARWSGGRLRWVGWISVAEFIRRTVLMAEELLDQCGGSEAYSKSWGGISFPMRELDALRQRLSG